MNNSLLEEVDFTTFLRMLIYIGLVWSNHVDLVYSKITNVVYVLRCGVDVQNSSLKESLGSKRRHGPVLPTQMCVTHGSGIHGYNTRARDNLKAEPHRTSAFEQLPSYVGAYDNHQTLRMNWRIGKWQHMVILSSSFVFV
ncbi:hypothetical protein J6590_049675 [Homalodisca vitripennis]|nr:hypothetical protein J6590_049675 [Homalodisca vitripennis]